MTEPHVPRVPGSFTAPEAMAGVPAPSMTPDQLRIVRDIVRSVVPQALVMIFGSRATGRARPYSDLDLLFVRPSALTWAERALLRDAFDGSLLPFRVDLVDGQGMPALMAERISAQAVPL